MAVDVRCEICNRLLRRVEVKDLDSVTRNEICDECNITVGKIYKDFEQSVNKFKQALNSLTGKSDKDMEIVKNNIAELSKNFDAEFKKAGDLLHRTQKRYMDDMNSLLTTTRAEVGDKIMKMGRFFK